jgi:hypothetical protein
MIVAGHTTGGGGSEIAVDENQKLKSENSLPMV